MSNTEINPRINNLSIKAEPALADAYFYICDGANKFNMAEYFSYVDGKVDENVKNAYIEYRGEKFSFKDYVQKIKIVDGELIYPSIFYTKIYKNLIRYRSQDYRDGAKVFLFMEDALASGRLFLLKAKDLFPYNQDISWESLRYSGYFCIRARYLNAALLQYNATMDLMMQVVFISFGFYKYCPKSKNKDNLIDKLAGCNYEWLSNFYAQNKMSNEFKLLWDIISKAHKNNSLANSYANIIKHKLGLSYRGVLEEFDENCQKFVRAFTGNDIPNLHGELIDLDETINKLVECHKKYIDIINELYQFIEFDKCVENPDFSKVKVLSKMGFDFKYEVKCMVKKRSLGQEYIECSLFEAYSYKKAPTDAGIYAIYFKGKLMKIGKAQDGLRKRCSDYYRGDLGGTASSEFIDNKNRDDKELIICMYLPKNKEDCWWMERYMQGIAAQQGHEMPWEKKR